MVSRARRRSVTLIVTATLAAGAAALTGCSADLYAATSKVVPAVPGANADLGPDDTIAIRDVTIAYKDTEGYAAGTNAPLTVRLFNSGTAPVHLTGVAAPGYASSVLLVGETDTPTAATPTPTGPGEATAGESSYSIAVAGHGYALLVPGQGRYLQLTGLTQAIVPGQTVPVSFTFDDGSSATLTVPVAPPATPAQRVSPSISQGHE